MQKPVGSTGMMKGVGKWITLGVTTAAAIAGLLVNARNLGLTPWLSLQGVSFADMAARRVTVAPTIATLDAIGDTLLLTVTVADQHGATLSGATLVWRTDDSSVAVVDSSGVVVARGPGEVNVSVSVKELNARTRVTVDQKLVRVAITSDSALTLRERDEASVTAVALDARGHLIRALTPMWNSTDTLVAKVRPDGRVEAVAPGRARMAASVSGKSADATVNVLLAPASIKVLAGADQRAPAGRTLPERIVVQVLSRTGRPVPGITVRLAPRLGQGTAQPASETTDRDGRVRVAWTLAAIPGRQRLLANADGIDDAVAIEAEGDPVRANTRIELFGEPPTGRVGEPLSQFVAVRVTDSLGAVLFDVPVTWTPISGGKAEPVDARTDSMGVARARWILGPRPGTQRLQVYAGNPRTMPAYPVEARAMSGWPAALNIVAGGGQRGAAGAALPQRVVVQVVDKSGNPIPDIPVAVRAMAGETDDTLRSTDATGNAAFRWTLGRAAGGQALEFRTTGVSVVARTGARALPRAAANLAVENAPAVGAPGRVVPISVVVTDEYGNAIPDAAIVFAVKTGALSATRVLTNAQGRAATRWTLGSALGDQALSVSIRATTVRTTHTVSVAIPRRR